MNLRNIYLASLVLLGVLVAAEAIQAQRKSKAKPLRALPPAWSDEVRGVFFSDAREKLTGARPQFSTVATARPTPGQQPTAGDSEPTAGGVFAWSKIISAEAIEDEIKNTKLLVDETVTIPGKFKGGGNRDARKQFSTLAVMFAIAAEYDGQVRWQDEASGLRELFAQAGFSCKVGTTQSYNQAKLRKTDLEELVRGGKIADLKSADAKAQWDKVANRPPLMSRMELAYQKRLKPWLASEASFKGNADKILNEAQILAALGEVIQREGYEYWDDEDYLGYAKRLQQGATDIAEGVKLNSYDKASAGLSEITKSCSECHEGYRS